MSDEGFLARWSRRKAGIAAPAAERGDAAPAAPLPGATAAPPSPASPEGSGVEPAAAAEGAATAPLPPPTLADVAALTGESDYARFMAPGVDSGVRNAAMKKLFSDPRFNVMDGLDVYIDDYSKPDPLPLEMLKKLRQSELLGLFREDVAATAPAAASVAAEASADNAGVAASPPTPRAQSAPSTDDSSRAEDDPDLRLQPDDGDRRPGAGEGPRD